MNKCKFCNHSTLTENNERVCTKHLLYVGDDVDIKCDDFEVYVKTESTIKIAVAVVLVIALMIIML